MKALITGGAGFLGYHLANYLNSRGVSSVLCDIASFEKNDFPDGTVFHNTDIRNKDALFKISSGVDCIVHAAAALPLWSKNDIYSTNIDGTKNVLEAAVLNKLKRVIYISSTAVYGIPKKHPIEESDPLIGVGAYGESKITAENVCLDYIGKGLDVTIIRPKTFLGPGRLGVFQILYDWIKSGKKIPVLGNGKNRYQLLAVEDLTAAIYEFLISDKKEFNDAFNIGAEEFGTVLEDLGALCEFAKNGAKVFPLPAEPVKAVLRILDVLKLSPLYKWVYETADKDSFVSIKKIKKVIDYQPRFSNQQTLINSFEWYLDHLKEIEGKSGLTHRVAWDQGLLKIIKRLF